MLYLKIEPLAQCYHTVDNVKLTWCIFLHHLAMLGAVQYSMVARYSEGYNIVPHLRCPCREHGP